MGGLRVGDRGSRPPPLENHKLLYDSLKNSGTHLPRQAFGPPPATRGPIAFRGRSVRPSMKYVDDLKKTGPSLPELPGSSHELVLWGNAFGSLIEW